MLFHSRVKCFCRTVAVIIVLTTVCPFFVPGVAAKKGRDAETGKHFLWSVASERNTIYLLGSVHILKKNSYPLPQAIENIYGCCKTVVFETDLDGMNDPDSQKMIMKRGLYPQGHTLSGNVSRETHALLKTRLEASGLSIAQFDRFKPWFVAMTITGLELQRLGFDPDLGIDRYFYEKAKQEKRDMVFLETNNFQLNLMASLNKRHQDSFLRGVLKELDVIESLASEMLDAWNTGNGEKLDSILKKSNAEDPEIYDRFFVQRNRKWITHIKRLMKQDNDVLIIVGAGHLVGKESVIDLLIKKGYSVMQR